MLYSNILNDLLSKGFSLAKYEHQVIRHGLVKVWDVLISYLKEFGISTFSSTVVDFYDIGRLYETGLAFENKYTKKETGKYYTPRDVSILMSNLLIENEYLDSIVDVGCGCGNLIIEVLSQVKLRS